MSSSQFQTWPILSLPAELRAQIYVDVLLDASNNINLLLTCQQIYHEAHPLLFKRPLTFSSQSHLCRWLDRIQPQHLHHVSALTLSLQDIDLSPILTLTPMPGLLCWELYEQELSGICVALRRLPQLRNLTLARSTPYQLSSYLYREFLREFCGLLIHCCRKLSHVTLHEDIQHFSFIPTLQGLRSVRLVGYSDQQAAHAFTALSALRHLETVELVTEDLSRSSRPYGQRHLLNTDEKAISAALGSLPPLTSFTIHESPTSPSVLTPSLLATLAAAHGKTLRKLNVYVSATPSLATLAALHTMLAAEDCKITELELCWPDVEPTILEWLLPRSLESLRVGVEGHAHAFDLLWGIIQMRSEVRGLCTVGIVGDWKEWGRKGMPLRNEALDVLADELQLAIGELRWLGVGTLKIAESGLS